MTRTIATLIASAALVTGLSACGPRPADPCSTTMPAPTAEQINKLNRGLEVDESIEHQGYELECVLVEGQTDGTYLWVSEVDD